MFSSTEASQRGKKDPIKLQLWEVVIYSSAHLIPQVIKATRDECPMCRQKLSPAILQFLETRDPHWTAPQTYFKNFFRQQSHVGQAPGLPVW